MADVPARPELVGLDPAERQRVLTYIESRGGFCKSCAGNEFDVGAALYLGFLFLDEDSDAFMVALSCRNPGCRQRHTGVVLHENDFRARHADRADLGCR